MFELEHARVRTQLGQGRMMLHDGSKSVKEWVCPFWGISRLVGLKGHFGAHPKSFSSLAEGPASSSLETKLGGWQPIGYLAIYPLPEVFAHFERPRVLCSLCSG